MQIKIITDNQAHFTGVKCEHGLAVWLEDSSRAYMLDTGMTPETLRFNVSKLKLNLKKLKAVFLSHGHYDHTGGLSALPAGIPVYYAPGVELARYSRHADGSIHNLSMPEVSKQYLRDTCRKIVTSPVEADDGIILTGPIPRLTDEDTGGEFFLDKECQKQDFINDEEAVILTKKQILITGCGHAGIINTLLYAKSITGVFPTEIIGGLHLLHATESRLKKTKKFLQENGIKCSNLLHCTGEAAKKYLC